MNCTSTVRVYIGGPVSMITTAEIITIAQKNGLYLYHQERVPRCLINIIDDVVLGTPLAFWRDRVVNGEIDGIKEFLIHRRIPFDYHIMGSETLPSSQVTYRPDQGIVHCDMDCDGRRMVPYNEFVRIAGIVQSYIRSTRTAGPEDLARIVFEYIDSVAQPVSELPVFYVTSIPEGGIERHHE